jgi:DNA polymerase-3 subunit alpha
VLEDLPVRPVCTRRVIIAPGEWCGNWPPCSNTGHDVVMTQFDMNYVEKAGLIKMDFLDCAPSPCCRRRCVSSGSITRWILISGDSRRVELHTRSLERRYNGSVQFESQGMQDYLRKLRPTCIESIAMTALYRPVPWTISIPT